ncbi:MAG: 5-methyltetrahydropteroyltriglutamate--homocysteine S-methyltransferase, partial [Alphaproteobacteria bacterium]|nr:5-methyltetrahydropteroyltriglutamate--homocysteine S-methyltransferase [Alphaproteobacteria bacterium]
MPSSRLPFRAEHIGSLLRPAALKRANAARKDDPAAYEAALETATAEAIRMQEEVGLRCISDGEFRRASWFSAFFQAMPASFGATPSRFRFHDPDGSEHSWPTCCATAPIRRQGGITLGEYDAIRSHTDRLPKVTMPTPSAFHFFAGRDCADAAVYPELDAFWEDLVRVYREEIAALHEAGASYVQLDEVPLAMLCDPRIREQVAGLGEDPAALTALYVEMVNRAIAERPAGMHVGIHLCRGNFRGRWMAAGGYGPIAQELFNVLDVDSFFLEYDSERAGDFAPLAEVPADKTVVLGLIGTKTPVLEETEALARRIDEATRHVPLERLCLSPQCGFAS